MLYVSTARNVVHAFDAKTGERIWTYREAMVPAALPKSLLIVGSGAIGIEFASFFQTLGSKVTVVEVLDRVLPVEDAEISALAHKAFGKQGMDIRVKTTVKSLKKGKETVYAPGPLRFVMAGLKHTPRAVFRKLPV